MADVYVYSGAAGTNTGASWANAFTNLSSISGKAAGDVIYVAHDHAQTQASLLTITSPGSEANPCRIYCVNRAGSVPPVSADLRTTATVSTTGANNLALAGTVSECYGITFTAGDAANTATIQVENTSLRSWRLANCKLKLGNTSISSRIGVPSQAGIVVLDNTTVEFGAAGQGLTVNGKLVWRNTSNAILGSIPNPLFATVTTASVIFCEGIDFSALSSSTLTTMSGVAAPMIFKDCKLASGMTTATGGTAFYNSDVNLIRSDSGDTNYRSERYNFMGTLTTETTIVRSGGASDGTTPISWKIVTRTGSRWEFPFECLPISIWNETTGSAITITIEGIWGGGAVPNNDEIWINVEYLGTAGFPLASKATSTKANGLAGGTAIPAGSGTWGGSTTKFAMSVTVTPQEKGPLTIYVNAAKVSSTFYVDPKPVIT